MAARPPRIVMLVANPVVGDSRVLKSARTALEAGYDVVVVGLGSRHHAAGRSQIDGVPVLRLRPSTPLHAKLRHSTDMEALLPAVRYARRRAVSMDLRATVGGGAAPVEAWDRRQARLRQVGDRVWWHVAGGGPVPRAVRRVRGATIDAVVAAQGRRGWATAWPLFLDHEVAFTPAVLDLEPALLHAHDVQLSHVADRASRILAQQGVRVPWIYDAHEWLPGVPIAEHRMRIGTLALERDQIVRAHAVMTVSGELADRLVTRYRLPSRPVVVHNAPSAARVPDPDRRTVREEAGVPDDVPLLVYAGAAAERRGLGDLVEALAWLPEVHLALVVDRNARYVGQLRERAAGLGCASRLHVLPYVRASSVSWYLSTADVGVAPFHRTPSHDVALATKVREYLHAGLPLVASDCVAMAQFVRATGVGRVFTAQDVRGLVRAARDTLERADEHRGRITPALLRENSWEQESRTLIALYERLLAG